MSNPFNDYWDLDKASEHFDVSKNTLTKWRLDAIDAGHSEVAEPDATYGNTNLYHRDKWRKVLEIRYEHTILRLRELGLVFDQEQMQSGLSKAYDEGYASGYDAGRESGLKSFSKAIEPPIIMRDASEPLNETEDPEPLVAYATTKQFKFDGLTDGNGFQSIV